jgi:hypothetical protein
MASSLVRQPFDLISCAPDTAAITFGQGRAAEPRHAHGIRSE